MKDQRRRTNQTARQPARPSPGQSLAPVGVDLERRNASTSSSSLAVRQRRLRGLVAGVAGAMALLIAVAFLRPRLGSERPTPTAGAPLAVELSNSVQLVPAVPATEPAAVPFVTPDLAASEATVVTSPGVLLAVDAAPSSRPLPQKIAPSERKSAAPVSGVSRPQSSSVFDAPFVPPH